MSKTRIALLWGSLALVVLTTSLQLWSPMALIVSLSPWLSLLALMGLMTLVLARQSAPGGLHLPLLLWTGLAAGLGLRLLSYLLVMDVPDRLGLELYAGRVLLDGLNPFAFTANEVLGGGLRIGGATLEQARDLVAGSPTLSGWLLPFQSGAVRPETPLLALPFLATSQALTPETPVAWFAILFGVEATTLLMLLMLLRRVDRAPGWVLLFWINPLWVLFAFAQGSSFVLLAPVMVLLIWAAVSERSALVGLMLALALAFNLWLGVLLGLLLRTAGRRPFAWRRAAYGLVGFLLMAAGLWALHRLFGAPLHWFGTHDQGVIRVSLLFSDGFGLGLGEGLSFGEGLGSGLGLGLGPVGAGLGQLLWVILGLGLGVLVALPPLPDQTQRAARALVLGFILLLTSGLTEPLALVALMPLLPLVPVPAAVLATGFGLIAAVVLALMAGLSRMLTGGAELSLWGQPLALLLTLVLGLMILIWLLTAARASFRRNHALE